MESGQASLKINVEFNGHAGQGAAASSVLDIPIQEKPVARKRSYGEILEATVLIGGSSAINLGVSVVRAKAMALLLGPAGVGLLALYSSISDLVRTIAGLGINNSGVRQIAEAAGTGDTKCIARTVTVLRRVALGLGVLGALLLVVMCRPVSLLTFGEYDHAGRIALLSLVVFFGAVMGGQGALLRGMRRVADIARLNVLGAVLGTAISISVIYFYGEPGVVPALVGGAFVSVVTSWWYARKVRVERVTVTARDMSREAGLLLRLGLVFTASALMTMGTAYALRTLVLRHSGLEAAGLYQAAWAFGGIYVGFILQAMGVDFYPRLTAVAKNRDDCNRLVNEQAEIGLLLAGPGALATLALAPLVIRLFYSAQFDASVEILRWNCLGMILRVASWPLGYVLIARNEAWAFFWTELANSVVQISLTWVGLLFWGVTGAGVAFFASYLVYWAGIFLVVRQQTGFRWSAENRRIALVWGALMGGVFSTWYWLPHNWSIALGVATTVVAGIYSLRLLVVLVPMERLPRFARGFLNLFKPAKG